MGLGEIHFKQQICWSERGRRFTPRTLNWPLCLIATNVKSCKPKGTICHENQFSPRCPDVELCHQTRVQPQHAFPDSLLAKKGQAFEALGQDPEKIAARILFFEAYWMDIHSHRETLKQAEVNVVAFYIGMTAITKDRKRCKNKLDNCQLGMSALDCKDHPRRLAYDYYFIL